MFEELIGNDHVKVYLKHMLDKQNIANTLLFSGPDGIGKSLYAKHLSCQLMYPEGISDVNKKKIFAEKHSDLVVFYPEGKTGMHGIAQVRELIEHVYSSPYEAKAKVIIVHDAERMLPSGANALLKTLEEPLFNSYIILLSSRPDEILPTILSRCMKVKFALVAENTIAQYLQSQWKKNSHEANQIATLANGSVRRAVELVNVQHFQKKKEIILEILSKKNVLPYPQISDLLLKLDEGPTTEEEEYYTYQYVDFVFSQILMWYRDLHLLKMQADTKHLFFSDHLSLLKSQNINNIPSLEQVHKALDFAKQGINRNLKLRVCLENLLLQLSV
jgi:DNA polymerase-3 subunit delta'